MMLTCFVCGIVESRVVSISLVASISRIRLMRMVVNIGRKSHGICMRRRELGNLRMLAPYNCSKTAL